MKKEYNFTKAKRGAVISQKGKTRITIFLDNDVLEEFRSHAETAGHGYQTMINNALREYLDMSRKPLTESTLRRIIQEELSASYAG